MNEQQMEAVERLVDKGLFPKGLIAVTETPNGRPRGYLFISRDKDQKRTVLHDVWENIMEIGEDDEGEEWKHAGVT